MEGSDFSLLSVSVVQKWEGEGGLERGLRGGGGRERGRGIRRGDNLPLGLTKRLT